MTHWRATEPVLLTILEISWRVSAFGFDLFPRNCLMNAVSIEKEVRYGSRTCDALAGRAEGRQTLTGEGVEPGYMDGLADAAATRRVGKHK